MFLERNGRLCDVSEQSECTHMQNPARCLRDIRGTRDKTTLELLSTKKHLQGFSIYFS